MLDPDGVTRTTALGSERMARKLSDTLPGGQHPLRSAVWDFVRPMLSPRLVALHREAFVLDDGPRSTVDLDAHRGESSLEELEMGEQEVDAAYSSPRGGGPAPRRTALLRCPHPSFGAIEVVITH